MEKAPRSRRKFIKALVLAAVSLPVLGKYLIPRARHKKPLLRVPKKDLPGNGALVFKEKKIAVVQKNEDVFALELTCTHLGCTVNPTTRGFVCPCHGSIFGPDGKVLHGPAVRPLPRRKLEKDGEHIVIS